jgi:hypothetical protein
MNPVIRKKNSAVYAVGKGQQLYVLRLVHIITKDVTSPQRNKKLFMSRKWGDVAVRCPIDVRWDDKWGKF